MNDLERMRHSAAHVMAEAVLDLFPEAKLGIGPPIEDGFYYDLDLPRPLTPDDLEAIENRMRAHIAADEKFESEVFPTRDAALEYFTGQPYKEELIRDLPEGEAISLYRNGPFVDLCRGPHLDSTKEIGAIKLMSVAGAYWRGDEKRPMLQRIYGTAWPTQAELDAYLVLLEEARKRDHRKLGRELGLFYFNDDVGAGIPLFSPKGEQLRYQMERYVREAQTRYGYEHVWTGHLVKESLYRKSGHYDNYADVMFPPMVDKDVTFRLKPMNCPSHMSLYNEMGVHSYRDLPLRLAEFATLYRYELSGALSGLTRVRALTQDDCHIFCTEDQIQEEFSRCLHLITEVLETYGLTDYRVQLSLPGGEGKYVNDPEKWSKAIAALRASLDANGVAYDAAEGEAAFYGPKADFMAKDALGREWQLSTIQVDFIQPGRLNCEYIAEDGAAHTPVVLHRAVTGSTERFLGVIIEHFAGAFPVWLSPVQAKLIPIADRHLPYMKEVAAKLTAAGIRAEVDSSNNRMNNKIRAAQVQKIPYMLVAGDRDIEAGAVSVRLRTEEQLGAMTIDDFIAFITPIIETKSLDIKEPRGAQAAVAQ